MSRMRSGATMREVKIPEKEEKMCIDCSRRESNGELKSIRTLHKPVKVKVRLGEGPRVKCVWQCSQCGGEYGVWK